MLVPAKFYSPILKMEAMFCSVCLLSPDTWLNSHKTQLFNHSNFFKKYLLSPDFNTVTYRSIARQRLGKNIPAGANASNNRTSTARERISKEASLTIEAVFSAWSLRSGYKEVFSRIK
jgi:hypothetical protein